MRQLGILHGSSVFGDDLVGHEDRFRTKLGTLKDKPLKAIRWYEKEHALKLEGAGAYPYFYFRTSDLQEQKVHLGEIVSDYEAHLRQKRSGKSRS